MSLWGQRRFFPIYPSTHPPIYALLLVLLCSVPAFSQSAFSEVSAAAGLQFVHQGYHYGGGIAVGDFNGDGWQDMYVTNGYGYPNALFLNNGDGTFRDAAASAGVADTLEGMGTVCGDIDNDGDLDIFLSNHWGPKKLFLNDGSARFTEVGAAAGVGAPGPGTSAALADFDNDGWLDIYLLNHAQDHFDYPNALYRNNRDGTFRDVTAGSGVGSIRSSLAVGFFDFNNDRYPDIYLVNEYERDEVFLNLRDGTFRDLKDDFTIPYGGGMGVDMADYDNDGDIDVYVSNLYRDFLLRNDDGAVLTDATSEVGIENLTMGWGVSFLDYDNDGDRDIHVVNGAMIWPASYDETNVFFRNNGNGFFNEVAAQLGLDSQGDSRASACADFNNDGYVDIAVLNIERDSLQLFENRAGGNNWLQVKLTGRQTNRCGIGAKVEISAGGNVQMTEIRSGSSFASNHGLAAAFGLKRAEVVDYVTVHWPSGQDQTVTEVAVNQVLAVTEPEGGGNSNVPEGFVLYQNFPNPFNPETEIPYRVIEAGSLTLQIVDAGGRQVRTVSLGAHAPGDYTWRWDGRDRSGISVASGVYIYRLNYRSANGNALSQSQKMVLLH